MPFNSFFPALGAISPQKSPPIPPNSTSSSGSSGSPQLYHHTNLATSNSSNSVTVKAAPGPLAFQNISPVQIRSPPLSPKQAEAFTGAHPNITTSTIVVRQVSPLRRPGSPQTLPAPVSAHAFGTAASANDVTSVAPSNTSPHGSPQLPHNIRPAGTRTSSMGGEEVSACCALTVCAVCF